MKPPSAEALNQAIDLLLSSIREENCISAPPSELGDEDLPFNVLNFFGEALPLAAKALNRAAATRTASCRKRRNALLPISKLPYETLIQILLEVAEMFHVHRSYTLHRLAQVATSWWALVISAASLWNRIEYLDQHYPTLLKRSRDAPIHIIGHWMGSSLEGSHHFVRLLTPERHRWKTLSVDKSPPPPDILGVFLDSIMPQLEDLTIKITTYDGSPYPVTPLSSTTFPLLRYLCVSGVGECFKWITPPTLPFLRYMIIESSDMGSFENFHTSLAASPLLETLEVVSTRHEMSSTTPNTTLQYTTLLFSHLRTLSLHGLSSEFMTALINCLHAPVLSNLHTHLPASAPLLKKITQHGSSLLQTALHLSAVNLVRVAVTPVDSAVVEMTGFTINNEVPFLFVIWEDPTQDIIMDFIGFSPLDYPEAPAIELDLFHPYLEDNSQTALLQGMPSLKRITFKFTPSIPVLLYLSNPLSGGGGVTWPCPMLREIALEAPDEDLSDTLLDEVTEALQNMVHAREIAARDGEGVPAPVRIVELGKIE